MLFVIFVLIDFTKQYNRLRQKLQTTSATPVATTSVVNSKGGALSVVRGISIVTRKIVIEAKLQARMKSLSKYANRIHLGMCNLDNLQQIFVIKFKYFKLKSIIILFLNR